jgi:translation initiation factor IF-2
VGTVNKSDVLLADASDAVIIAFRVHMADRLRDLANELGLEVIHYDVIYHMVDQIKASLEGMLEPEEREERLGLAEVRALFRISRLGVIAGCFVREGLIRRNARIRILRNGEEVTTAAIAGLRQEKNDVREVAAGRECGINAQGFNDWQEGDLVECFETVTVRRTLSDKEPAEAGT